MIKPISRARLDAPFRGRTIDLEKPKAVDEPQQLCNKN
jgi:hypothetical protein